MGESINQKIADLDKQVEWFYSDDFELDKAADKYSEAIKNAKEIEEDLEKMKNKIEVIAKDFSKE